MVRRNFLVDEGNNWRINMPGAKVSKCQWDYGMVLMISDDYLDVSFRISGRANVHYRNDVIEVDTEQDSPSMENACRCLAHQEVSNMKICKDGMLTISFANGVTLTRSPDEEFEAWEATSEHQEITLVSTPGGGLAIWESPVTGP